MEGIPGNSSPRTLVSVVLCVNTDIWQDVVSGHKCPGFRPRPVFANSRGSTLGVCGQQRAERPAGTAPGPRQVGIRDRWHWGVGLVRQEELRAPECMQRGPGTFEDEC